jgi:hypothetical protein
MHLAFRIAGDSVEDFNLDQVEDVERLAEFLNHAALVGRWEVSHAGELVGPESQPE